MKHPLDVVQVGAWNSLKTSYLHTQWTFPTVNISDLFVMQEPLVMACYTCTNKLTRCNQLHICRHILYGAKINFNLIILMPLGLIYRYRKVKPDVTWLSQCSTMSAYFKFQITYLKNSVRVKLLFYEVLVLAQKCYTQESLFTFDWSV